MSAKKMSASEKHRLGNRMAEYLDNHAASKKPKFQGRRSNYDFGAKKRAAIERATHKPCFVLSSPKYRENFDSIFRK